MPETSSSSRELKDLRHFLWFSFFVIFILSVIWFAIDYDSEITLKPNPSNLSISAITNWSVQNAIEYLNNNGFSDEYNVIINWLLIAPADQRIDFFKRAGAWQLVRPRAIELIFFLFLFFDSVLLMWFGYRHFKKDIKGIKNDIYFVNGFPFEKNGNEEFSYEASEIKRHSTKNKLKRFSGLLLRDLGPLSFDVATHENIAVVTEYRGIIHWARDVIEKLLSVSLVTMFVFFLTKTIGYLIDYISGKGWRLIFVPLDIQLVVALIGIALIIDGFVIISSMTDAPGIGRVLDSLIVILAGFVVMQVEVMPAENSIIKFNFGEDHKLAFLFSLTVAILFVVRWVIRNQTVNAWIGNKSKDEDENGGES